MQQFISSIRSSITTQNWFGALFMALAIPDICAALEHGETSGVRYRDWFDRYLKAEYNPDRTVNPLIIAAREELLRGLALASPEQKVQLQQMLDLTHASPAIAGTEFTASDCYKFRCKSLHQGISEGASGRKIAFSPPPNSPGMPSGVLFSIHKTLINDVYVIDIAVFCENMCEAVEGWLADNANNSDVQRRIFELMNLDTSYLRGFITEL